MGKKTNKEEEVEIISDELDKFSSLEALYLSKGGEMLFKSIMADVCSCVDTLSIRYNSLTHLEFISLCAELKTKLDLARVMKKSTKNKEQATKDLENALLDNN